MPKAIPARAPAFLLLTLCTLLAGCVGFSAAPLSAEESIFSDPNAPATHDLMARSARWVVRRYPPSGEDGRYTVWDDEAALDDTGQPITAERFIVNLPPGIRPEVYRRVLARISPNAEPVTDQTIAEGLPVYHIGRVFITGDTAKVDVFKPLSPVGATDPSGRPLYQAVTVRLRGGFKPWQVTSHQVWTAGALPVPPLAFLPERADQLTTVRPEPQAESADAEPSSGW